MFLRKNLLMITSLLFLLGACKEEVVDVPPTSNSAEVFATAFADGSNAVIDPVFASGSVVPTADLGTAVTVSNTSIDAVTYKGAINPNAATPWYAMSNWSFYAQLAAGNTVDIDRSASTANDGEVTVTTTDLNGNGNLDSDDDGQGNAISSITWTADNIYYLEGFVFVSEGQTLTIEAGTVIKGKPGTGENASALVIARGGKIYANGTAAAPIIMTYMGDPLDGTTDATTRGQWGGLILLGSAKLNSTPGETQIEGIPTTETKGLYGGSADDDSSGELHYVSIRHGGTDIGAGNEINGLTLGGVGSGTIIDHIEVIGNADDGIEWFGGAVNATHLIVAYQGDDGLDYDEGFRGASQFVIVHQDPAAGDRGGEHDGGTSPETAMPYATPTFANVTSVGKPAVNTSRAITFRDNAGGFYYNSIFVNYGKGVDVEDLTTDQDSYQQFLDGNLGLEGNVFFNIGAGDTDAAIFTVTVP